jgi:hypothetical protein
VTESVGREAADGGRPGDRPRGRRNVLPLLVVAGAIVTAVALLALRVRIQPPTVPPYVLEGADGGIETRGETAAVALAPGQLFEMDVEPEGMVTGAVGARAFLIREESDEARVWEAPFEVAKDGSVHLAGKVEKLFDGVPPGAWDVAVVVGRPETLPTSPRDAVHVRDGGPAEAAWRLVERRIVLGG